MRPLPGGAPAGQDDPALDPDVKARLAGAYGSRASEVAALYTRAPELARRIVPDLPYLWAEVVHAVRAEHAREVADVLCRRVPLSRDAHDQGLGAAARTGAILAEELGWSEVRKTGSIAAFHDVVARTRRWREEIKAP
jgi:glycerol-3-phosphate dehydrogenase